MNISLVNRTPCVIYFHNPYKTTLSNEVPFINGKTCTILMLIIPDEKVLGAPPMLEYALVRPSLIPDTSLIYFHFLSLGEKIQNDYTINMTHLPFG